MRVHVTPGIRTLYKKQRTAQLSKVQYCVYTSKCRYVLATRVQHIIYIYIPYTCLLVQTYKSL